MLIARAHPRAAQSGDWRSRVLTLALRAVRAVSKGALAAEGEHPGRRGAVGVDAIALDRRSDHVACAGLRQGVGQHQCLVIALLSLLWIAE